MMKCSKCQVKLPDNAKFCNMCGADIKVLQRPEVVLICNDCGYYNPLNSKYCLQCGKQNLRQLSTGEKYIRDFNQL